VARQSHRDLVVWQKAVELVLESHRLADRFPPTERFVLTQQLVRAAVSVPANIAEGHGRVHRGDYIHHVSIARGSLMEVDTLLEVAERRHYVEPEDLATVRELVDHIGRMLTRLWMRLRARS
jgi:four helix bundle protein